MRKIVVLFLMISILGFQSKAASRFVEKSFFSASLNAQRTYYISYPNGYNGFDTSKKYPVVIFLHGAGVSPDDFISTVDPIFANILTQLLFPNIYKVILIVPDGSTPPYMGSFYTNSELYGNFEDYIYKDLVSEVASKYNTYNARAKWALMGHSMGGYGAMKIALKHPDVFEAVASLSGPLNITYTDSLLSTVLAENGTQPPYTFTYEGKVTKLFFSMAGAFSPHVGNNPPVDFPIKADGTIDSVQYNRWLPNDPIHLIRGWNGSPEMGVYFYCGRNDEYKLSKQNYNFRDTLIKYSIPYKIAEDDGDHVNSLAGSFPDGINYLYKVMDSARIVTSAHQFVLENTTFSVYPNPVTNQFKLKTDGGQLIKSIEIFDITGHKQLTFNGVKPENSFDISNVKPGIYLIKASFENGMQITKQISKN